MATIQNNTAFTLQPSSQQAVRNGMANVGVDFVEVEYAYSNEDNPVLDLKDEDGNYLFSLDTSDDKVFDKQTGK